VETGTALVLTAGMAGVTYCTRLPLFLLSLWRLRLPELLDLVLAQIPVAAFAAIVVPGVLAPHGHVDLHASNLYLFAALGSVAVTLLLRNIAVTIVVGVGLAIVLRQLFG
jgi:branched-subunit amino acid transport protein